jgi:cytochrome c oxidase assembly protein subunit 15
LGKQRLISSLAFCASFFALGVIALGAFTRLIDAGLGCPDWPGCYGMMVAPLTEKAGHVVASQFASTPFVAYKAWAEMVHRYFVSGLSIFILSIITLIFSQKILRTKNNILLASGLFLLLIYQIMLGRWTVTLKLLPIVVTQHLLGGFFILSLLWLIYLNNKNEKITTTQKESIRSFMPWSIIAIVILLLQITLGAWTSTNYASLSCADFPFCMNDQPWMTMHFKEAFNVFSTVGVNYEGGVLSTAVRQTIQMTHRLGALIFSTYICILMAFALPRMKKVFSLMKSALLILGLLCIQLCIGIANVIFKLPLATALSHNLVAVLLLLSVITFTYKLTQVESKVSVS